MEQVIEAVLAGLQEGQRKARVSARLICCAMRQEPPALSETVARVAVQYRQAGVVALDLAGPEVGYPAEPHRKAFEYALDNDLHLTLHAGEACCPDNVVRAMDLGAQRIGHGTFICQDERVAKRVADSKIPLEVCPTSNLQICGFIEDYAAHPIHQYLRSGMRVTLNTDNRLMSNVTLSDEFSHLAGTLSRETLRQIAQSGFQEAFLPAQEKQRLLDEWFA